MKEKFVSASNKLNKYVMAIDGVAVAVVVLVDRMTSQKSPLNPKSTMICALWYYDPKFCVCHWACMCKMYI